MREPWKCPDCKLWINPALDVHSCETGAKITRSEPIPLTDFPGGYQCPTCHIFVPYGVGNPHQCFPLGTGEWKPLKPPFYVGDDLNAPRTTCEAMQRNVNRNGVISVETINLLEGGSQGASA